MNNYDAQNIDQRKKLADSMTELLLSKGFSEEEQFYEKENVFSLEVTSRTFLSVFSTIENGLCRPYGRDSIKICALYVSRTGELKGFLKSRRINRSGTIDQIIDRLDQRTDTLFQKAKRIERCSRCGGIKLLSKKNNLYCSELCWKRTDRSENDQRPKVFIGGLVPIPSSSIGKGLTDQEVGQSNPEIARKQG